MNKVILMGRLTRDVEMRQTPNGVSLARFSIAVNRRFAGKDAQAEFVVAQHGKVFHCHLFYKESANGIFGL